MVSDNGNQLQQGPNRRGRTAYVPQRGEEMRACQLRRIPIAMVLVAMAAACFTITTPAPANAAGRQVDCLHGHNGFEEISDFESAGTVHGKVSWGKDATVTLEVKRFGGVFGTQKGFARLYGERTSLFRVWMDVTNDFGRNWGQCGPFRGGGNTGYAPSTTSAYPTSKDPARKFRACGDEPGVAGSIKCTPWW